MLLPHRDGLPEPTEWPALYEAGLTLKAIAAASGRTYHAVRLELLQRGLVLRQGGTERGGWYAEAALLRAEGATLRALGRRYGVTWQAVAKALCVGKSA
jgi:hypothetical protein